jgi:serine/threonine-protein kinase
MRTMARDSQQPEKKESGARVERRQPGRGRVRTALAANISPAELRTRLDELEAATAHIAGPTGWDAFEDDDSDDPDEPSTQIDGDADADAGAVPPAGAGGASQPRYHRTGMLGEGGMGVVYACHDRRIGREVALKTARRADRGPIERLRFLREAQVQGQLEHPAVVPVYDLGSDGEGGIFLSMKRVRGERLTEILAGLRRGDPKLQESFTRRRLLSAFADVCLAVEFAHQKGVLHRDLKPGNIMLGDFGEVYLLDWGLAHVSGEPEPVGSGDELQVASPSSGPVAVVQTPATSVGQVLGTPGYMSPEMARGENDRLGAQSDVYMLGAILFEILTLQPLHARQNADIAIASTLKGANARARERAPEQDVPPELEAICIRATDSNPARRQASARELHRAIEQFLEGDRDLELRRRMADAHAAKASTLADEVLERKGSDAQRGQALRQVGQALGLDPGHKEAMRTLLRLLTEPPGDLPPGAREELAAQTRRKLRLRLRMAALGFMVWLLYLPVLLWVGVKSWPAFFAQVGAIIACILVATLYQRKSHVELPYGMIAAVCLAVGTASLPFGPLVYLPLLAMATTMIIIFGPDRRRRDQALIFSGLVVLAPLILEWTGVMPPSYEVRQGALCILPRTLDVGSGRAEPALALFNVVCLFTGGMVAARYRNLLNDAERRLHLQAWQLKQVVGSDAPDGRDRDASRG